MLKERVVYVSGDYVPWDEAKVHMMSHSFGRGSAIFEVIGFHDTVDGPAVFRLDEHLGRFMNSASLIDMGPPLSPAGLTEAILVTLRRNGLKKGMIKLIGFYPEIAFEILPPKKRFQVAVFVLDPVEDLGTKPEAERRGVTACVPMWRRLDPQTVPIEAKAAANYLNGIMARGEARRRGFDYAVMLDTQGFLAEGGTESVFLVREGRLMTPSLGTILNGISRKSILDVARQEGIETVEGRLSPELLEEAEEIFLSSTPFKILPVWQVEDRILGKSPGPVTQRLTARMEAITAGRDERFRGWLFPVT